ncbi:MAG: hypothetical protein U9O65_04645 [Thermotogota bacterium]|nr:hypothetical protein [Thermotogota bacterium]
MGEKLSFIKHYNEMEHEYREKLNDAKTMSDVGDVFIDHVFEFLSRIDFDLKKRNIEHIVFTPEKEKTYYLEKPLREKAENLFKTSDLESILEKMAEDAKHRFMKIQQDQDRTEMFRRGQ